MRYLWAMLLALPLAAADIAVAPQSLTFTYQYNSGILVSQAIVVASAQSPSFTVTRPAVDSWLVFATPNAATLSVTAPLLLQVAVDPARLAVGTYTSALTLRFAQGAITVPVTLQITLAVVAATDPAVLFFDPATPFQNVAVGLSNPTERFLVTPSTTTPWLTVTGAASPIQVTASSGKAPPGITLGAIQVRTSSVIAVANNPLTVPAVFLGNSLASVGPLTVAPSTLSFTGAGSQQVTVSGGTFTVASDSKWLTAAVSGSTLNVSADPAGLAAGTYQGALTLASGSVLQMFPVTLTAGGASTPVLSKVVNAASYASPGVSPGEIVVLGGTGLGPANLATLALDSAGNVANSLAGVQVRFNGIAAPIVYASAGQVAVAVPYEVDGAATANVVVSVNGQQSNSLTLPVVPAAPGIFTADASGAGPGAILNGDLSVNGAARPAAKGEVVAIYMTGEGQTNPAGVNGKVTGTPPVPRQSVTATVDGQPVEIRFAGEAPGILSGVMQVNVAIPATARTGDLPVVVTVGGVPSQNGVTVSVR
jgi:trimeric autotransporter adhesin